MAPPSKTKRTILTSSTSSFSGANGETPQLQASASSSAVEPTSGILGLIPNKKGGDKQESNAMNTAEAVISEHQTGTESKEGEEQGGNVPHYTIRTELKDRGLREAGGDYITAPAHGAKPDDVTAPHKNQLGWRRDDPDRPAILKLWAPPPQSATPGVVGNLTHHGKTVVDYKGHPIKNFPDMPLTISSSILDFHIEALLRENHKHGVNFADIVARLPPKNGTGPGTSTEAKPCREAGALREAARRGRNRLGLKSWAVSGTSTAVVDFMDRRRTDDERRNNLVHGDLSPDELKLLEGLESRKTMIAAAHPARATASPRGGNTIDDRFGTFRAGIGGFAIQNQDDTGREGLAQFDALVGRNVIRSEADMMSLDNIATDAEAIQRAEPNQNDVRQRAPETPAESATIHDALHATRLDFFRCTGQQPAMTSVDKNYNDQWGEIHEQLVDHYHRLGGQEPPELLYLEEWMGGLTNWASATSSVDRRIQ